jgi:hypothetical protein
MGALSSAGTLLSALSITLLTRSKARNTRQPLDVVERFHPWREIDLDATNSLLGSG